MARSTIDLNADLGEGCAWDAALLERVTSAAIGCGAHAGTPEAIRATLRRAGALGVVVGAHPGYPDRDGFGRVGRDLAADAVERLIVEQVETLRGWAEECGAVVRFLKPHGALYHQAQRSGPHAEGVVAAAGRLVLPLFCQRGSVVDRRAAEAGVRTIHEGFADRGYRPDGSLIPRGEPGAFVAPEAIAGHVLGLVGQGLDTICVHGDGARAVELADRVREALARAGIGIHAP